MDTKWLTEDERAAWVRLVAVVELLPGMLDTQLTYGLRPHTLRVLRTRNAV
ncbi:hypothetical protein [Aeromicrobium sp. UC242_57]|uniref:hypothetical protein n=1 Tax=Aeromicrobium sp. UC242_57 TaxID=3374624 RepID=UPI00378B3E94